ncbi:MAG: prepilin-type N-terminal cleavage/methylation domain-containing protein [Epsilonproteobacteria bacterium]|nr:prepilin-type N-terminal cleavage/methylation domain-containing protein [Campylobacterota bacterium]
MKHFAFTLLELVFVIIVIGILAVLAMPNFRGNPLQTAAEQVASHIRYTQHLAMVDDIFNPNDPTWWQTRWQIQFENAAPNPGKIYVIYRNLNKDTNENDNEIARDPLTRQLMKGADKDIAIPPFKYMDNLLISKKYGITNVIFSAGCNASGPTSNRIGFDNLGRPYTRSNSAISPYANLMTVDCNITLVHPDGNATITVSPETGYVSVN